jgi:hypothetical protein
MVDDGAAEENAAYEDGDYDVDAHEVVDDDDG